MILVCGWRGRQATGPSPRECVPGLSAGLLSSANRLHG
jgi:hypothetical protein